MQLSLSGAPTGRNIKALDLAEIADVAKIVDHLHSKSTSRQVGIPHTDPACARETDKPLGDYSAIAFAAIPVPMLWPISVRSVTASRI
jgi:hypothetical protein